MGWGKGTGTCVGEDATSYIVLTNAHVVGNNSQVSLKFFKGGYQTGLIPGTVIWRAYQQRTDVDLSLVRVAKSHFGRHPPRVIPIAPVGYKPQTGNYIAAAGCPSGRWLQSWEGHVVAGEQGRVIFVPQPIGGQSGSGLAVLIRGTDGEIYTRIGAVLTWRDERNKTGAAIPIGTFYALTQRNSNHQPYYIPTSYTEASTKMVHGGTHALGNDNKIYKVYRLSNGGVEVRFPEGTTGVDIVNWDYYKNCVCPYCGRNHPPYGPGDGGDAFGFGRRGGPGPFGRQPQPPYGQPQPGPQPYPTPGPAPTPGSPYGGVNPPDIGAPWPGQDPIPTPVPGTGDRTELDRLNENYERLLAEKKALEERIVELDRKLKKEGESAPTLTAPTPTPTPRKETSVSVGGLFGMFGGLSNMFSGFAGGITLGLGIGALGLLWTKILRKRIVKGVDSLQDYIQQQVEKKWGKDSAVRARDLMEGAEEAIMGVIDDFLTKDKAKTDVAQAVAKGQVAERIVNGGLVANADEVMEAVKEAAKEVGDDKVTTEVPAKVQEILRKKVALNSKT
jgi:cell division septum initiation protein DivIVA